MDNGRKARALAMAVMAFTGAFPKVKIPEPKELQSESSVLSAKHAAEDKRRRKAEIRRENTIRSEGSRALISINREEEAMEK